MRSILYWTSKRRDKEHINIMEKEKIKLWVQLLVSSLQQMRQVHGHCPMFPTPSLPGLAVVLFRSSSTKVQAHAMQAAPSQHTTSVLNISSSLEPRRKREKLAAFRWGRSLHQVWWNGPLNFAHFAPFWERAETAHINYKNIQKICLSNQYKLHVMRSTRSFNNTKQNIINWHKNIDDC